MGTATKPTDDADHRKNLHETLESAGTVMMVTRAGDGSLHSRPMAVARIDADNTLYFTTGIDTPKVLELQRDPRVDVFFQSKSRYASIAGSSRVSQDRKLIADLWQESWKVWFPKGKEDPDIAIVIVEPDRGEYWDQSGLKGLSYLYRAAKAYVTGTAVEPKKDGETHGTVKL